MKRSFSRLSAGCCLAGALMFGASGVLLGELHSKSKDLTVELPADLPEQARTAGESCYLYLDDAGPSYLYIAQNHGTQLAIFDVSNPARIRLAGLVPLNAPGAFDFVRPLNERAALVRFRDNGTVAVMGFEHPKTPTLGAIGSSPRSSSVDSLGRSALLIENDPNPGVRATPHDFQVIDASTPSAPMVLATVKQVSQKAFNSYTGTTFLLGSEGLTVIRDRNVEENNKLRLNLQASN